MGIEESNWDNSNCDLCPIFVTFVLQTSGIFANRANYWSLVFVTAFVHLGCGRSLRQGSVVMITISRPGNSITRSMGSTKVHARLKCHWSMNYSHPYA